MIPLPILLLTTSSWTGCASSSEPHGHDHAPEGGHEHAAEAPLVAPVVAPPSSAEGPGPFALGPYSARLEVTTDGLRLMLVDAAGAQVPPVGEARVALTGVGETEQRVVLRPNSDAWTGSAKSTGAKGYTAAVRVEIGGLTEVGSVSWGELPAPPPALHTHEGADAQDHGHGH